MTARQAFINTLVVIFTLLGAYIVYTGLGIFVTLLIAIIIASALRPVILWLQKRRVPYGLAIVLVYVGLFAFVAALLLLVIPPAVTRIAEFIQREDMLAARLVAANEWIENQIAWITRSNIELVEPQVIRDTVASTLVTLNEAVPSYAGQVGTLMGNFALTVIMGVYWLTSRDQAVAFVSTLFALEQRAKVQEAITDVEHTMGAYVRGMAVVATFVGVANFALLTLLGVPNAVTLAFIIGICTLLPVVGGFIGAGVSVFLSLLSSPLHALFTLLSFVLVQQVEANYMTPRVMSRSLNLNPILVLLAVFIGFAVGGVLGGILALPVAGTLMVLARVFIIEPMQRDNASIKEGGAVLLATARTTREAGSAGDTAAPALEEANKPTILRP